ncbi:MAG: hypothetical protein BRC40_06630 [Cyanobacteria bacterium QH_8_48_120]|jgi:uncharacterized membrane protein/glutaredoxin|nr:MAG: hypothetical protein BRC35_05385 [Cyanobacteria bacterium QH_10_48_56]PSO65539.1 MAG: hypothetical protein BRC36_03590 [Cyanobacteria bacterium QH_2_48_84]PSO67229.1 MAG: hypothetical protein BRC38_03400 [Cyanobacteria bacterium QH_6_48_35]PSO74632.1 MAG: hypothetical protein BRC40_06630 [Cyanobacteria bacterium QH_8_48_120]PSO74908.1 MAG: hypothetical protein BRC37_06070 [Cyanobacteria bacterium QH_3_48_40]PSO84009.1 MAG: hypothetical protein BRC41_10970 [Cyanobacteria bacterium QH_9_
MKRRRSTPWIYRWSRTLIGTIAVIGATLTAYLTVVKLTGSSAGCPVGGADSAGGCNSVLSSPYATVFGLPLTLFGFLAYTSMSTFALAPLAINQQTQKSLRSKLENWTWLLLLVGGVAMTIFSGYLMYILALKLQTVCPYCIASALFSLSLLTLTILGRDWEDVGQIFFIGIVVGMVTLIGTLGVYSNVGSAIASDERTPVPQVSTSPQPGEGWSIKTTSGEAEMALAEHLNQVGATMYGAYWCPHCHEQKQLFGKEAVSKINYIECDPGGNNPQPQKCESAGVKSYPTWKINGETYRGTQSLTELAEASGYEGSTNFKYSFSGR